MLSSSDNRKVPLSIISRGLSGLISFWWTAQNPLHQPADRDDPDRAAKYDGNDIIVSGPRPPPTTIKLMKEGRAHLDLLVVVCARASEMSLRPPSSAVIDWGGWALWSARVSRVMHKDLCVSTIEIRSNDRYIRKGIY
jgi:hypothetical protein